MRPACRGFESDRQRRTSRIDTMLYTFLFAGGLAALYLIHINAVMKRTPEEARRFSPTRWSVEKCKETYEKVLQNGIDLTDTLPPKQSRRYIVIGGSGTCSHCLWLQCTGSMRGLLASPRTCSGLDVLCPGTTCANASWP